MQGADLDDTHHHHLTERLAPWQFEFAHWLACQDKRPLVGVQCEKASELAQKVITSRALRQLKERKLFKEAYGKWQLEHLRRARKRLERDADKAVRAHLKGLAKVAEIGTADDNPHPVETQLQALGILPRYTVPVLDRVAPKTDGGSQQAVNVTINLSAERKEALLTEGAIDVDYEVLDDEEAPDE